MQLAALRDAIQAAYKQNQSRDTPVFLWLPQPVGLEPQAATG